MSLKTNLLEANSDSEFVKKFLRQKQNYSQFENFSRWNREWIWEEVII